MARTEERAETVANSRELRDKIVGHLATLSRQALLHELVSWTVAAQDLADESRELRRRRAESRGMLELIAREIRGRQAAQPAEVAS